MPKTPKPPKERKQSDKQAKIMTAVKAATIVNGEGTSYTPAQIGNECGKAGGSPASDWAYPAIKTLVRKGILVKDETKPGRYKLPTTV